VVTLAFDFVYFHGLSSLNARLVGMCQCQSAHQSSTLHEGECILRRAVTGVRLFFSPFCDQTLFLHPLCERSAAAASSNLIHGEVKLPFSNILFIFLFFFLKSDGSQAGLKSWGLGLCKYSSGSPPADNCSVWGLLFTFLHWAYIDRLASG